MFNVIVADSNGKVNEKPNKHSRARKMIYGIMSKDIIRAGVRNSTTYRVRSTWYNIGCKTEKEHIS